MITGIFATRTHEIIPMQECKIHHPVSGQIVKLIIAFLKQNHITAYQEKTQKGLVRHIIIKIGMKTKQLMCILVINGEKFPQEQKLVEFLLENFKTEEGYQIKTIIKNTNRKNTNVILGDRNTILYGDGYIYAQLGEYTFKISPMSFYQTNPIQTEVLYAKAIEAANLQKEDILLDLYCGIGTIGIYASKFVKQVYGIEIVEQAIEDAKDNAKLNQIDNIEFVCGNVEKTLDQLIETTKIKPNVIFVDPPRRGLDNTTITTVLDIKPEKLIYISCNPATMVRDLKQLEELYNIKEVQPVDMFPFTSHVECVAVLNLK